MTCEFPVSNGNSFARRGYDRGLGCGRGRQVGRWRCRRCGRQDLGSKSRRVDYGRVIPQPHKERTTLRMRHRQSRARKTIGDFHGIVELCVRGNRIE